MCQDLLHNLRTKQIDSYTVAWIDSFLTERSTIVRTKNYTTERVKISPTIPLRYSLSPILLIYNSPLPEAFEREVSASAAGFVK